MDLFVFGTLLHMPLLEVVSGDADVATKVQSATRPDYQVSRVSGQVFPMMHAQTGAVARGVIVQGLSDKALARLDYYEKAFGYDRVEFEVLDADQIPRSVTCYVPDAGPDGAQQQGGWTPADPWDRDAWTAAMGEVTTMTAREAMTLFGVQPAQAMGASYAAMMARAASRQRAQAAPRGAGMGQHDVDLIEARKAYAGFFTVQELDLTFRQFDGAMSDPVSRTVFVGVDCAIVLPYDPVRDRVLVVEQFRPGAYLRGDPNPWTMEPIAGRIDATEGPDDAARRETLEEAGVTLTGLHTISAAYPSPGTTSEYFFVFLGICDLPDGTAGEGGLATEAEDIRSHVMDWADFDADLNAGRFNLLPLLVAGHWLARNRDRLRGASA